MSDNKRKKTGLGRGLSALMADIEPTTETTSSPKSGQRSIPVDQIEANPEQPRKTFESGALDDLTNSIREKGIIQPLIVRPIEGRIDRFQLVAGERRWRAAQKAQLHEVPVVVRKLSDADVLEIAIIENIQRADLNPVEEALGYKSLQDKFGHTQEVLSKALGKSRSHIANLMRLLNLPEDVLDLLRAQKLSSGHARALVVAENPSILAAKIVAEGLSVRQTEKLVKSGATTLKPSSKKPIVSEKDADTRALEQDLSAATGMKVTIDHASGQEAGEVTIKYRSLSQLDWLCQALSRTN